MEMLQLTSEHTLFPPRAPLWSLFGWWTGVSILAIGLVVWYGWKQQKKRTETMQEVIPNTHYTLQQRHSELKTINTSIRTPKQKAQAMIRHCFAYLGIDHDETIAPALTISEIQTIPQAQPLLQTFTDLFTVLYTDAEITHAQINNLVSDLIQATSGS